ncbi:MAG: alpha/beta fold hydrolase [Chlamydiae bacterium]|nr:alpha/beta fold hydrolase [Chlamydiota bacterium]
MLPFNTYGSHTNPPLIFLHGLLGFKEDWNEVISRLEDAFYCIAIDLPGHGQALSQIDPLSAIKHTIDQLGIDHPSAVGYSLGGRILMKLQKQYPFYFDHLTFLSAHPGLMVQSEKDKKKQEEEVWIERMQTKGIEVFLKMWYDQPLFSSLHKKTELLASIIKTRSTQNLLSILTLYRQFRLSEQEHFRLLPKRTSFFYGEEDLSYKNLYMQKQWNIPLFSIADSSHAVHLENPHACSSKIRELQS